MVYIIHVTIIKVCEKILTYNMTLINTVTIIIVFLLSLVISNIINNIRWIRKLINL